MDKLKLRLTVDVTYDTHGVKKEWLEEQLRQLAFTAVSEGLMTGSSDAEVDEWDAKVVEV